MRHQGAIRHVEFSPDGARLASSSYDKTARLWGPITGVVIGTEMKHGGYVWRARFNRDGSLLLTASFDGTAQIWNGRTGSPQGEPMNHGDMVYDAVWSDDSSVVLTYGRSGSARLWNAAGSRPLGERLSHRDRVDGAVFLPGRPVVATCSRDGSGASPRRLAPRSGKPHSRRSSRPGWSWVTMTSRGCWMRRRGEREATHSRRCEGAHGAEHLSRLGAQRTISVRRPGSGASMWTRNRATSIQSGRFRTDPGWQPQCGAKVFFS
jgi:WD40 repeat protein